ncbi:replication factor A protein, partial [Trifolium pratense]
FRVRFEVIDGKDTCVFAIFDSDMSYMMEKSCAFFVAQSKGKIAGPHPIEFDSLVGKKMLLAVDKSANQSLVGDGCSRVRRVCMDSAIIAEFCADCGYSTPVKGTSPSIDIDSDGLSGDLDGG